jgi:hypothetical protein
MKTFTYPVKDFKVVSVSSNTNSFGLYGVILVAKDGEAIEIAVGSLYKPNKGDILIKRIMSDEDGNILNYDFEGISFEIPRTLPIAPKEVVNEIWK